MADWTDEYKQMVKDCENRIDLLSDWEQGFIHSMRKLLNSKRMPTPKQLESLDRVWENATRNG